MKSQDRKVVSTLLGKTLNAMTQALIEQRPEQVALTYATDAVIVGFPGPTMPFYPVTGRSAIEAQWRETPASHWTLDALQTHVDEDTAVQYGRSTLTVAGQTYDTAFICVWKQGPDGTWLIQADIFKPWTS